MILVFGYVQFPSESQVNSRRYHLVFCMLTCPTVDHAEPANMYRPSLDILTVYYVVLSGEISSWNIVELYRNHYNTSLIDSPRMNNLKAASCPAYLSQFKSGVLTMDQIDGADLFT